MIIALLVILNCVACKGQSGIKNEPTKTVAVKKQQPLPVPDTLSVLSLQGRQYGSHNYQVLHLSDLEKDEKSIVITKDGNGTIILLLPKADDEVKNFSITGISKTEKGFRITAEWGGGRYFYGREFYFSFKYDRFYLDLIRASSFNEGSSKKKWSVQAIQSPIPIEKFKMIYFLENE